MSGFEVGMVAVGQLMGLGVLWSVAAMGGVVASRVPPRSAGPAAAASRGTARLSVQ